MAGTVVSSCSLRAKSQNFPDSRGFLRWSECAYYEWSDCYGENEEKLVLFSSSRISIAPRSVS